MTQPAPAAAGAVALRAPTRIEVLPRLQPRDEAVFLLHTAAEIEHALMVQYLYAAWSLPADATGKVGRWRREVLQVAREEMAHLAAVQNLLRFVGGPLNFDREDFPYRSELYPFPFRLEPLEPGIAGPVRRRRDAGSHPTPTRPSSRRRSRWRRTAAATR